MDAPQPVLAGAPHPFWRTPALRAGMWLKAAWAVLGVVGRVLDARIVEPSPVGDAVSLAHADLVLVAGLAFIVAIRAGSFSGGGFALVGVVACGLFQKSWSDWPLRVLDPAGAPQWKQTKISLLLTGATCLALGLLYLRARGLRPRRRLPGLTP